MDVRGPMGMTPLMIASFCGDGVDTGDIENVEDDDPSSIAIQDLINQYIFSLPQVLGNGKNRWLDRCVFTARPLVIAVLVQPGHYGATQARSGNWC